MDDLRISEVPKVEGRIHYSCTFATKTFHRFSNDPKRLKATITGNGFNLLFKRNTLNPEQNLWKHNYVSISYNLPWYRHTVGYMHRDWMANVPGIYCLWKSHQNPICRMIQLASSEKQGRHLERYISQNYESLKFYSHELRVGQSCHNVL